MARIWPFAYFLLLSFAVCALAVDYKKLKEVPKSGRISGVFMIPEKGEYIFNATEARAACQFLKVTLATKAQMETALQHGLQTCKFGWIDEQVAVIPRTMPDQRCGKSSIGLVQWKASANKRFGAFCFKASDVETDLTTTTVIPVTSKSATTLPALTFASTRVTSRVRSKPRAPTLTKSTTRTSRRTPRPTTTPTRRVKSTRSTTSSPTSHAFASTSTTTTATTRSLSHPTTSSLSASHFVSSTTAVTSTTSVLSVTSSSVSSPSLHITLHSTSTQPTVSLQSVISGRASIGAIPMVLIILAIILLLLTAAAGVWYYKLKRSVFPFLSRGQKKDDTETEMWKQTESEMNQQNQQGGEEEEGADRKYSSDITLCANPEIKTNSS